MHAKAGNKRQLTWSASDALFSVLHCLSSSGVLLCCLPFSPFFSLFSSLLFPFFYVLLSFSWKLALIRMKTIGAEASALSQWLLLLGTTKAMATPVLVSIHFLLLLMLMLSLEMMKMMAMKACCAGGVVALASVFSLLSTVSFLWLSLPCLSLISSCLSFLVFLCSLLSFLPGFPFFSIFFLSSSSTACPLDLTATQGWRKETPSVFCVFFYCLPLWPFSCLSFVVPPFRSAAEASI